MAAAEWPGRACRIGEAIVAIAIKGEDWAESYSVLADGIGASRSFETAAGGLRLLFGQFSELSANIVQVTLQAGDDETPIEIAASLAGMLLPFRLPPPETAAVLQILAGAVNKLFGLQRDPVLTRALYDARRLVPQARMQLIAAEGYHEGVLRFAHELKMPRDSLVLAFAAQDGAVARAEIEVGEVRAVPPVRMARAGYGKAGFTPAAILVLGSGQAAWFEVVLEASADAVHLYDACARSMPEAIAVLTRARGSVLGSALLSLAAMEDAVKQPASSRRSGFCFAAETLAAFEEGLFVSGWMHDPENEFRNAEVADYTLRGAQLSAAWQCYDGFAEVEGEVTRVTGFCAWLKRQPANGFLPSPAIAVTLADGARLICRAAPASGAFKQRDAIASAIHLQGLAAGALPRAYRPAFEAAAKRLFGRAPSPKVLTFGGKPPRGCSIVIPLFGNLRFLRSQLLAFAGDRHVKESAEIVYVVDDPRLAGEAEQRIAGLAEVTGLDIKVILPGANLGFARASNIGAGAAEGKILVLMNSDAVPDKPGWLLRMAACLENLPPHSVVGPKLLYADQTLQHAGMYFYRLRNGAYQNMHYFKGYGRDFAPANIAREVPAVTGAVMVLARGSFLSAGGFTADYVIGDYEDSDLCLKLRAMGGICQYLPSAELYHFERQSMSLVPDVRGEGATAYNRQLHHDTWAAAIGALMKRADFRDGVHVH